MKFYLTLVINIIEKTCFYLLRRKETWVKHGDLVLQEDWDAWLLSDTLQMHTAQETSKNPKGPHFLKWYMIWLADPWFAGTLGWVTWMIRPQRHVWDMLRDFWTLFRLWACFLLTASCESRAISWIWQHLIVVLGYFQFCPMKLHHKEPATNHNQWVLLQYLGISHMARIAWEPRVVFVCHFRIKFQSWNLSSLL